jgi:nicotinamidase-related amidase
MFRTEAPVHVNDFNLKRSGILFFDILNGFYHDVPPAIKERLESMVSNAVRIRRVAREAGVPVFFAKSNHRPDAATTATVITDTDMALRPWPDGVIKRGKHPAVAGQSSSDVIPELEPAADDYYIPKFRRSAFFQTYFDLALRTRKIDTLVICGCHTEVGVAATIFAARDLDYNIIVIRDACATIHDQHVHELFMDQVFPRMGRVRSTAQLVELINSSEREKGS